MKRNRGIALIAALAMAGLAAPARAQTEPGDAQTGGASYDDGATATDGGTLSSRRGLVLGATLRVRGALTGTRPGDTILVERLDTLLGWVAAATATIAPDGWFLAEWRPDHIGRTLLRAVRVSNGSGAVASSLTVPVREVTIFRPALATFYGPGLYGRRTACGRRLTRRLLGVAHPRLPCGTQIDLLYRGRRLTVPVVDRGPFRAGTSWDLTAATARALRFTHTDTIGAVRVRAPE